MCNGATFSAPTVIIDCSGNNSCKNIEFDEDVVKTINLTCGPFGPGPNEKYDDNNVCGGIEIPHGGRRHVHLRFDAAGESRWQYRLPSWL